MKKILYLFILCLACICPLKTHAEAKRLRHEGLFASQSSSTSGRGNLIVTAFGRSFLWDNNAAQKIPPTLPHLEINYGVTDYLDIMAGTGLVSYTLQPGEVYLRAKMTTPDNKMIRLFAFSQIVEVNKNLSNFFPSNGYRVQNEGFGPEGFIYGNSSFFNSYKFTTALDLELIRLSSYLPFKFYLNLGITGEWDSWIEKRNQKDALQGHYQARDQSFAKVPMSLGLELKTYDSDFFVEVSGEPFVGNVNSELQYWFGSRKEGGWTRFQIGNDNGSAKNFDVHIFETPWYAHAGTRVKYENGLTLTGGFSWLLSTNRGAELGSCRPASNACRDEGVTDGFSPFYPQWKVFGQIEFPIMFTQPSSELYRSFMLKRYEEKRKVVDVDQTLKNTSATVESDLEKREKKLQERRKEADDQNIPLN